MQHPIEWHTAQPLWAKALEDTGPKIRFKQPALLRFAEDSFMEKLQATLAANPAGLSDLVAIPETWREPAVGWQSPAPSGTLKLYQPVHQRYYLLAASLVCKIAGMPDRKPVEGERVYFALRRLVPTNPAQAPDPADPGTYVEHAWLEDGAGKKWSPLDGTKVTVAGKEVAKTELEEQLPLFPSFYNDGKRQRRLWLGFIPVDSGDSYRAEGTLAPFSVDPADLVGDPLNEDARIAEFRAVAAESLSILARAIASPTATLSTTQARETFLFAAAETAVWLADYLPEAWAGFEAGGWPFPASSAQQVFNAFDVWFFDTNTVPPASNIRWHAVLSQVYNQRLGIFDGSVTSLSFAGRIPNQGELEHAVRALLIWQGSIDPLTLDTSFTDDLGLALGETASTETGAGDAFKAAAKTPKLEDGAWYTLRCFYHRPACRPDHRLVVSRPSAFFQLAAYFDTDAPWRPLNINLPVGTDLKDLRKFPKTVSMLVSDNLRRQMARFEGSSTEDLDSGDVGSEPSFNLGVIITLSIPIITLCATILLMIFVSLLNIVFFWLPYFKIVIPIKLKAKT